MKSLRKIEAEYNRAIKKAEAAYKKDEKNYNKRMKALEKWLENAQRECHARIDAASDKYLHAKKVLEK